MDEQSSGALSGAASGAAAGAVFGPWGAVIGGAIGLVGGLLSGGASRQARLKKMQINNINKQELEQNAAIQRRDIIRGSRIAYARSLAQGTAGEGEVSSTGLQGVQGSNLSQSTFNMSFAGMQAQQALSKINLGAQADNYQNQSQMYAGLTSAALSVGSMVGTAMKPSINPTPLGPQENIAAAPNPTFSNWGNTSTLTSPYGTNSYYSGYAAPNQSIGAFGSFTLRPDGTNSKPSSLAGVGI